MRGLRAAYTHSGAASMRRIRFWGVSHPAVDLIAVSTLLLAGLACSRANSTAPQVIRRALEGTIPAAGGTISGTTSGASQFSGICNSESGQAAEHVC